MILFDAPVSPDDITQFARRVPQSDDFVLSDYLPNEYFDDNEVEFAELTRTNRTARFRAWDGRLHVSSRDTATRSKVKLPPLSTGYNTGEYEALQIQFARTGGTNNAALIKAIYDDAENGTNEVLNRMELARGDVLTDGKFTMNGAAGEPSGLEADYAVPGNHIVAPATLWSDLTTSTPLTNMVAWYDVMKADGTKPAAIVTSNAVARLLQKNKEIIDAVYGSTQGRTRVSLTDLNDLLAGEDLPAVRVVDEQVDVDGTTTRVIADDRVLFLAANLGYTAWGVTATALELVNSKKAELDFEEARGIVGVVEKSGPPYREFTFIDSCGMPVITNPRGLLVADVK